MRILDDRLMDEIDILLERYPILEDIKHSIIDAYLIMQESYENDGKMLIAGNGGSAADAEHIAGELMKSFKIHRQVTKEFEEKLLSVDSDKGMFLARSLERGLPTIPLVSFEALSTAYINDVGSVGMFAQQLYGLGRMGDVFLGISTSGNSENIINAAIVAKALGMKVVGLTGKDGGKLAEYVDVIVKAPLKETYMIQELHLPIYHCWCLMLEKYFFG